MSTPSLIDRKKTCFVIAPIGDEESHTRKRSDKVLEHVFKAALGSEYRVKRADEISEPGMITSQILQAIQDYDLVVADLTEHNPNVFYELAVRHAIEKPIIHVTDTHWRIPFDVAGFRTIVFDFTDLDSVAAAIKEIRDQANEINQGNWGVTPIKMASVMRRTREESQDTLLLQETITGIAAIREYLAVLSTVAKVDRELLQGLAALNLAQLQARTGVLAKAPNPNAINVMDWLGRQDNDNSFYKAAAAVLRVEPPSKDDESEKPK